MAQLRNTLLLSLNDSPAVTHEFPCPDILPSSPDHCSHYHGVGNSPDLIPEPYKPIRKPFKTYEPGYAYSNVEYLPQLPDDKGRGYLFGAIGAFRRKSLLLNRTDPAYVSSCTTWQFQPTLKRESKIPVQVGDKCTFLVFICFKVIPATSRDVTIKRKESNKWELT